MTTPPEGYHPDPNGDNCKVCIEGVYVTVAQLAARYKKLAHAATMALTFLECPPLTESDKHLASKSAKAIRTVLHGEAHDAARKEAGL